MIIKLRIILFVSSVLILSTLNCFASNDGRIKELQKEGQKLSDEINKLGSEINKKTVRIYEINGAIKELMEQEKNIKAFPLKKYA